ncbi:plasmid mobilization protein [Mucilaginibacter glaciei]|uniref:MobC family plasmid mobilization relaxosome protein n=1 Tax=Mucilaginibacter glaciei TaxID=2772109 RepID=A0A926S7E7_9SPHI|nr:plasmid mobilization relaxosome protein MobC [Mucilaginibacter glaciei]MBD1394631.1 MobC family plasmid mobilization relaxosome protein [Mucilaginibacter glaciei]
MSKMARPKKEKEQKLSKVLVVRLTEGELKQLEQLSIMCSQHVSVLVRNRLFSGNYPKAVTPKITVQLYAELNRIGVNLNQLTRQVNSGKLAVGLLQVLIALFAQQQTIIQHLLDYRC